MSCYTVALCCVLYTLLQHHDQPLATKIEFDTVCIYAINATGCLAMSVGMRRLFRKQRIQTEPQGGEEMQRVYMIQLNRMWNDEN